MIFQLVLQLLACCVALVNILDSGTASKNT
jgi:hypothetical protein